ncbi:MAG: phosphate acetyltransferase [Hyphomicrobiales bacterium]
MENPMEAIFQAAHGTRRHIVLAEGEDGRIQSGAVRAVQDGLARITLIGNQERILQSVGFPGIMPDDLSIIDPTKSALISSFAEKYYKLRQHKGITSPQAAETVLNPLAFAAMMVRENHADGTIAGAITTTADTVRAALQIIGTAPDTDLVSSFFLMVLNKPHHARKGVFVFADGGLSIAPNVEELASIAIASAASFQRLIGVEPRVAMLSFSTYGSATHPKVDAVVAATKLAQSRVPNLKISGEMQFDAAFVPEVAAAKAPDATIQGDANIFIFPNLESANIGYKIAQRIGGAEAIGPILQGLANPANDLSRGCDADDVYNLIAVTCAQVVDP